MLNILASLVASLIFWLCIELIPRYWAEDPQASPQVVVREVRETIVHHNIPAIATRNLRIVARRQIPVRLLNDLKSKTIATLRMGAVVHLCQKNKKWMEIEWTDAETGVALKGWALSKHLKRVDRNRYSRSALDNEQVTGPMQDGALALLDEEPDVDRPVNQRLAKRKRRREKRP